MFKHLFIEFLIQQIKQIYWNKIFISLFWKTEVRKNNRLITNSQVTGKAGLLSVNVPCWVRTVAHVAHQSRPVPVKVLTTYVEPSYKQNYNNLERVFISTYQWFQRVNHPWPRKGPRVGISESSHVSV